MGMCMVAFLFMFNTVIDLRLKTLWLYLLHSDCWNWPQPLKIHLGQAVKIVTEQRDFWLVLRLYISGSFRSINSKHIKRGNFKLQ